MNRFLTALLLVACGPVAAQHTVFGLTLGQPVTLPGCAPRDAYSSRLYAPRQPVQCVQHARPAIGYADPVRMMQFADGEQPAYVASYLVTLLEQGGRVVGVAFDTPGLRVQAPLLDLLKQKFGAPTIETSEKVKARDGTEAVRTIASWTSDTISVRFYGMLDRLDAGHVDIDTPEGAAIRESYRRTKNAAEKPL